METRMRKLNQKNLQPQETANRILRQAMRIFLEKGYHGTSIDDITQAAGVTKGALYWHFKSKEDLLKRIVEDFEKRFLDGMIQKVREARGGVSDKIEKYFRYNAAFAYYNRELCVSFTTLSGELVGAHHPIEPEIRRIYKKYQNFLTTLILEGKKEKMFRKEIDVKLAALIMIAFHDGILLQWSMNRGKVDGEAYVNIFKKIVLQGLMA
jgi:AcrR family transcriptional regulator